MLGLLLVGGVEALLLGVEVAVLDPLERELDGRQLGGRGFLRHEDQGAAADFGRGVGHGRAMIAAGRSDASLRTLCLA